MYGGFVPSFLERGMIALKGSMAREEMKKASEEK
jgi:hypothetical protein